MAKEPVMSRSELEEHQNKLIRRVVKLAYNTRVYRRKFDEAGLKPSDIRTTEDLVKLPFSSKVDLVSDYMGAVGDPSDISVFHTTSGTSGTPTVVCFTNNDVEVQISLEARNLLTAGFRKGDVVQNTTPYGMFFAGIDIHEAARRIGAVVVPAGKQPTAKQQAWIINFFRPTGLIGIPQFILKWGYVYEELFGDPKEVGLKKVYALGEPLPEEKRKRIEDIWGAEVRVGYGLTEAGSGGECEERYGVHWPEDHTFVEVVDPETGERLGEGEKGELVFTTLTRTGTLALRYRSRDYSCIIEDKCSCGRVTRRVLPPEYRLDGLIKIKGALTSPFAIDAAVFRHEGVRDYLLVIREENGADRIDLFIDADEDKPEILASLAERLGGVVCFTPTFVHRVDKGGIPEIGRKAKKVIDLRGQTEYDEALKSFLEKYREKLTT
ncbi:MAG: AMP-binding protein [Nitrososphaerota archaeon]